MRKFQASMRMPVAAMLLIATATLAGCSSTYEQFAEEDNGKPKDTNLVKGIMTGLGAIDPADQNQVDTYTPRAALVMPPKKDLPTPQNGDAQLAAKKFPVNPEDRATVAADTGDSTRFLTLADQQKFANLPKARQPVVSSAAADNEKRSHPLTPDQMKEGHSAALAEARAAGQVGGKKRTLIDPPSAYAQPSPNAPFEEEKPKESSWKPSWWPL